MSIIDIRLVVIAAVCVFLLGPLSAAAAKKPKGLEDKDLQPSMACSSECGKKHGTGKVRGEAYNPRGYESCMMECMRDSKHKATRKEAKP